MSKNSERNKRLFFNASWLFGGNTFSSIFAAIETIVLARMLGINDYGLFALLIAYIGFINTFFDLRVWEAATKYIGTFWENGQRDKTLSMIKLSYTVDIASGILAFCFAVLTANIANKYIMKSPQAYILVYIYALSLLIDTANSTSDSILRVFNAFKKIAFINSFQTFFRVALVTSILFIGFGVKGVLISYVAASFLGFSIRIWAVSKTLNEHKLVGWWKAKFSSIRDEWKGITWFLGNTSFTGTLRIANDNFIGILLLGYFSGKDAAAYYKIARTIVKLMTRFSDSLHQAMFPELVKFSSINAMKEFQSLIKYSLKTLLKFTLPIAIFTLIFTEQIINIVFGSKYLPALTTLRVMTIAIIVYQLTFWVNSALLAMGKPGLRNIMSIGSKASYIAFLFLLIPGFSYLGAAIAYLGEAIVTSSLSIIFFKSSLKDEEKRITETEKSIS